MQRSFSVDVSGFALLTRGELWGPWHSFVYHTVNVIKSKHCQCLLARKGEPLSAPQTALHLSDWILVSGSCRHDTSAGGGRPDWNLQLLSCCFFLFFFMQYDLAGRDTDTEAKQKTKKCCFCLLTDVNTVRAVLIPHRLTQTSVYTVMVFLDRAPLWQITNTVQTIKRLVSREYWKGQRRTHSQSSGFNGLMVERTNRKIAAWDTDHILIDSFDNIMYIRGNT